jgi:hypothetical protein
MFILSRQGRDDTGSHVFIIGDPATNDLSMVDVG